MAAAAGHGDVPPALTEVMASAEPGDAEREVAAALAEAEDALILLGSGALHHPDGSVLAALAALLAERTGARIGVLEDGANAAGAWIAGAVPHRGPGGVALGEPGLDAGAMLAGGLGAFVLLGVEPEHDCADSARALTALGAAEFVVSLGAFSTSHAEAYADAMLPIAPFAETSGTFVNLDGRWQSFEGALAPPGEARPAWKVLRVLGNVLDLEGFEQLDSNQVLAEVRAAAGDLEAGVLTAGVATEGPRAANGVIWRLGEVPPYACDALVRRAKALQETADGRDVALRLGTALAGELGLSSGDRARVRQGAGEAVVAVEVDGRVAPGCVRLPVATAAVVGLGPAYGEIVVERVER